ncbi:MAG: MarR family transcriptional regulator [Chloroflexota bacterium]
MSVALRTRPERIKLLKDAFHALIWITTRQFSQQLQTYNLTMPQFFALSALTAHRQACTMRDLTHVFLQDPPTMTGIIDRLVRMKLVARTRSEDDRRVVLVEATLAGIDLVNRINEAIMRDEMANYSDLSDDDLAALEQLLRFKLRIHLGRFKSLQDGDLEAEIEKLQRFINDPIHYTKTEHSSKPN